MPVIPQLHHSASDQTGIRAWPIRATRNKIPREAELKSMSEFKYTGGVSAAGNAEFYGDIVVPFAEEIGQVLPFHDGDIPQPMLGPKEPRIVNAYGLAVALGVTVYVMSHMGKKVLDDVYEMIVKPRLKPILEKIDAKLKRGGKQSFNFTVWYEEFGAAISITVVAESSTNLIKQLELIPEVHRGGITWITTHGIKKPIHHYRIENGQVNPVPTLADSIGEVLG
jgi:hypothetical protein